MLRDRKAIEYFNEEKMDSVFLGEVFEYPLKFKCLKVVEVLKV